MTHGQGSPAPVPATLAILRGALLVILAIGLVGVLGELLLLEHTEETWQRLPIFMIIAGLIVLGWHGVDHGPVPVRALQAMMALFVLTGAIGVALHLKGNIEFELEMQPTLRGTTLLWQTLKGATPTLAPGAMVQLGLIGLAYSFHHPALTPRPRAPIVDAR